MSGILSGMYKYLPAKITCSWQSPPLSKIAYPNENEAISAAIAYGKVAIDGQIPGINVAKLL